MGQYDVGLVCLNGHEINSRAGSASEHNQAFCSLCGESTLHKCPACKADIRGFYQVDGVIGFFEWHAPPYCHACGQPYPWTTRKSEALAEALDELDELSPEEREKLKKSIPDILADTPKSETAALRYRKAMARVGAFGGKVLTDVLAKVATETIKNLIRM